MGGSTLPRPNPLHLEARCGIRFSRRNTQRVGGFSCEHLYMSQNTQLRDTAKIQPIHNPMSLQIMTYNVPQIININWVATPSRTHSETYWARMFSPVLQRGSTAQNNRGWSSQDAPCFWRGLLRVLLGGPATPRSLA